MFPRIFLVTTLILFASAHSPHKKKLLAMIASSSTIYQQSGPTIGPTTNGGTLVYPTIVVATNNQPATVEFSTTVKCCSSGNQVSSNFTVTVRMDGVAIKTQSWSLADMGYSYQEVPIYWSIPVNPTNGTHTFDVFVNSGGWTLLFLAYPDSPTFMNVYQ